MSTRLLAALAVFCCFASAGAQSLYQVAAGTPVAAVTGKYGKPAATIPFDDGWTAYVFQLKGHNLIVETSDLDPALIAGVQIQGTSNPAGMGLRGLNLGDSVEQAQALWGKPLEKRPSFDEKTNEAIPDAYIYEYSGSSYEAANGKITSIKLHFGPYVPGSRIAPAHLLEQAYRSWKSVVERNSACRTPRIVRAHSYTELPSGVIREKWEAEACGTTRIYVPLLTPDGKGGYLIGIGQ